MLKWALHLPRRAQVAACVSPLARRTSLDQWFFAPVPLSQRLVPCASVQDLLQQLLEMYLWLLETRLVQLAVKCGFLVAQQASKAVPCCCQQDRAVAVATSRFFLVHRQAKLLVMLLS